MNMDIRSERDAVCVCFTLTHIGEHAERVCMALTLAENKNQIFE